MTALKLTLFTIGLLGMMSAQAKFSAKKIEKNAFDELTITLPHYLDQSGKKHFFHADYQTAENLCLLLGKKRHLEYNPKTPAGRNLVAQNSVSYTFDDKMIKRNNKKAHVIYSIQCSGINRSERSSSNFSPQDESTVKRSIRSWSIRLGL